ncbi:SID1 transmembrane family member 1-like [Ptychodera flava]|uniref:SID1 transmembrane family member 1-like n=1 Tax=Ptychodera flava TaxID=63121 RepID=UPI00396A17E2
MSSPQSVTISPSQPQYYYFRFPNGVDSVQVRGRSENKICSVIGVQEVGCPVFDLLRNVEFIGKFQTQTTQSSITVQAKEFQSRKFFVVLLAHPDDSICNDKQQSKSSVNDSKATDGNYQPASSTSSDDEARLKNMTLEIIPTKPCSVYWTGTMVMTSVFLCFYIAFLVYACVQCR